MLYRSLVLSTLAFVLATGCNHAAAAASPGAVPSTPAPFASPPVLAGTPDIATLVSRVRPGVVTITTTKAVKLSSAPMPFPGGFGNFFGGHGFMIPRQGNGGNGGTMEQHAAGSGFIVDAAGHVITNAHVVEGADVVKVKLEDGRELDAKVVGRDKRMDVALLQLQGAKGLPAVSLGSSKEMRVGDYVVAMGNPFGLGDTVTMGIISAKSREIGAGPYDDFIQTDASINPGNSGGPLFNLRGQVIGINTAINPNGQGIGFAIPVDAVKEILPQLMTKGHVDRGRLGVVVQPVDQPMAQALGLSKPAGALVAQVQKGSPGEKAGIQAGDLILAVDGTPIAREQDLPRIVARHAPGAHVSVKVLRDGKTVTLGATLDELKETATTGDSQDDDGSTAPAPGSLGIATRDAPDGSGALVGGVRPESPADGRLRPGDVIVQVNHHPVTSASDLEAQVKAAPKDRPVVLEVRRGSDTHFVAIPHEP